MTFYATSFYKWLMDKYPNAKYEVFINEYTPETLAADMKIGNEIGTINYDEVYDHHGDYENYLDKYYLDENFDLDDYFRYFANIKASTECLETFVKCWNEYQESMKQQEQGRVLFGVKQGKILFRAKEE